MSLPRLREQCMTRKQHFHDLSITVVTYVNLWRFIMKTKYLKITPIAIVMALGAGQAVAERSWYHDESSDSIVFNVEGSRNGETRSAQMPEPTVPDRSWYYDQSRDTIVFNVEGSRSNYERSSSPRDAGGSSRSWYYDEDRDTIVFNVEGSRDQYLRM